jgi:hypothetical protein
VAAPTHPEPSPAERLIVATIGATWGLWLIGGLYIVGPALGWILAALAFHAWYLGPAMPDAIRQQRLHWVIWLWLIGMMVMLIALFAGHSNFGLSTGQTVKSAVGWAKGWALLALFPLAGAVLNIRLEAVVRAICRLGRQTLILLPIFLIAPFAGLPETLWVSPLKILGGSGDEYFSAVLYTIEPGVGTPRWQFFAPWSPAAGMVAVIHFLIAREEKDRLWRWTGMTAAVLLALLSQSRLALVALAVIVPITFFIGRANRGSSWLLVAPVVLLAGWFGPQIQSLADQAIDSFSAARADSSRVREALARIALQRWQDEAYWFGHGIVARGPHMVEYMPIGSHHSWYGLLYVKGLIGALALAIPMLATLGASVITATRGPIGRLALAMMLTYWLYSFGENLEVLIYLAWPALLVVGIAFRTDPQPPAEKMETEHAPSPQDARVSRDAS